MRHDQVFLKRLGAVAKLVGFKLDDDIIELYDRALAPIGYPALVAALETLALDLGPGKAFPSISAIQMAATGSRHIDPARLAEDAAVVAAAKVIEAVGLYGSIVGDGPNSKSKLERLKAHVGELGWAAVKAFGSWNTLCDMLTYDNMPTVQAQLRNHARAMVDRRAAGVDDGPPSLEDTARPRLGGLRPLSASDVAQSIAHLTPPKEPKT